MYLPHMHIQLDWRDKTIAAVSAADLAMFGMRFHPMSHHAVSRGENLLTIWASFSLHPGLLRKVCLAMVSMHGLSVPLHVIYGAENPFTVWASFLLLYGCIQFRKVCLVMGGMLAHSVSFHAVRPGEDTSTLWACSPVHGSGRCERYEQICPFI